ncbi:uncharacterized protein [Watersipora subatra]|uniref:uncharacterized protein n=1 Tax=Watersipora subatra TaxID=2589382 RepID=UPI00355C29EB
MAADSGNMASYCGQSLDSINVDDEFEVSEEVTEPTMESRKDGNDNVQNVKPSGPDNTIVPNDSGLPKESPNIAEKMNLKARNLWTMEEVKTLKDFFLYEIQSKRILRKDDAVKFLQRHPMDRDWKSIKYKCRDLMLKTMH